jgi:tRNA-specific 2-thiouridylase
MASYEAQATMAVARASVFLSCARRARPARLLSSATASHPSLKGTTVVVGFSGGVDSTVAAKLLLDRGANVVGVHMECWRDETKCAAESDAAAAIEASRALNIPLLGVNLVREYWNAVWLDSLEKWQRGLSPNPDALCNREIKFSVFLKVVHNLTAHSGLVALAGVQNLHALRESLAVVDYVATGHYARTSRDHPLMRPVDMHKDQTYYLAHVRRESLERILFPIGDLHKQGVRHLAASLGLPNHDRASSKGICFIGKNKFSDFVRDFVRTEPGNIVARDGRVLARHSGLFSYTLGQARAQLSLPLARCSPPLIPARPPARRPARPPTLTPTCPPSRACCALTHSHRTYPSEGCGSGSL